MDLNELQKHYNNAVNHCVSHKLHDAFTLIHRLIKQSNKSDFQNRYENHLSTYQNMLKYSFEYQDDPEKKNVYYRLVRSLLKLLDETFEDILHNKRYRKYYSYKEEISGYINMNENDSSQLIDSIAFEKEIENILTDSNVKVEEKNENNSVISEDRISHIFKYLWLSNEFRQVEFDLVSKIIKSDILPWYDQCLIVTSLTLSALRFFDEKKISLLFEFAEEGKDEVWQRSFIGLCQVLLFYNKRIQLFPDIMNRLKTLQGNTVFIKNLEIFTIQYIWQKESEKIAKKINEELMPDMIKMKSIIDEKLDLDNIVSSDPIEDKNPDWEDYFKDSPGIYKKFEEIQKLQTEGADIFMGAFAMLKQFPFFNEVSNWFVPFYNENKSIKNMIDEMEDKKGFENIVKAVSSTYFLCNSDKYSFCHNLKFVMQSQKPAVLDMFKSELDAMKEMADDEEKLNQNTKNKSIFTQYLQDLYRFYILYPDRNDFENVFNLPVEIHNSVLLVMMKDESKIIHKIGELYFNQNYYDKALEIFISLEKDEKTTDLLEKIAFCYHKTGKLVEAVEYYNKALLIDKNKKWKLQQLALCYRKMGNYQKSLELYLELEKSNEEDLSIQADIGQVYLALEKYEDALQYYFKVEYLAPDNHKVHRPIAWCSFILGKFDVAQKYFEKVIEKEKNKNDFLNLAHVLWCKGERIKAIDNYKKSFEISDDDIKWFDHTMNEDMKHLILHGIEELDIYLMMDYIRI